MKVLIVDDHEIVRQGLKMLLSDFYPNVLVSEAQDENSTVEKLKNGSFQLIILDVRMPNTNSLGLLEYIIRHYPDCKVLIFSMGSESLYGMRFIKVGARGYLSKEASVTEVKKAIDTVMSGRRYISPNLMDTFLDTATGGSEENPFFQLSNREFEIASFLLDGLSMNDIASRLHIQASTVGTYKSRIFDKMGVSNLIQLKELASLYSFP